MKNNNHKVKRHQAAVRKMTAGRQSINPVKMPDLPARLEKVFGNKVVSDRDMRHLWAENRGEY